MTSNKGQSPKAVFRGVGEWLSPIGGRQISEKIIFSKKKKMSLAKSMNLSLRSNSKDKSFLEIQGVQIEKEEQKAPSSDQAPWTASSNPCYARH